ncbi:MAG: hypothetical protein HOC95_01920 [Candidatus Diapherotrites archaeon]|nr:hypothetical protein [Candidatus Diapherotrites archaeon]
MQKNLIQLEKKLNRFDLIKVIFFLFLLFYFLFGATTFLLNDFTVWDSMGHMDLAVNINENLWPDYSGWNPNFYLGFQQGLYYPPLFHYLLAGVMFFFSPLVATKLLLGSIFCLFPFATYYFSKQIFDKKENIYCMTLVLTASWFLVDNLISRGLSWNGIGYDATMITGFLPAYLLTILTFLFLGSFCVGIKKKKWILPTIFLTLCFLTHFLAYVLLIFVLLILIFEKEKIVGIKVFAFSVILSCFWWLPMLANIKTIPLLSFSFQTPLVVLFLVGIAFVWSLLFIRKNMFVRTIGFFVSIITGFVLLWSLVSASFQFSKLHSVIVALVFIPIFFPLIKHSKKSGKLVLAACFLVILIFSVVQINVHNDYTRVLSEHKFDGRTLIILPLNQSVHEFNTSFSHQTNSEVLIGLFSESAFMSSKLFGFSSFVDSSQPTWGVKIDRREELDAEIIEKQIDLLALNQIVAVNWPTKIDKNLIQSEMVVLNRTFEDNFSNTFFFDIKTVRWNQVFNSYFLKEKELVVIPNKVVAKSFTTFDEWHDFSNNWFNSSDETIYFWSDTNKQINANPDAKIISFEKGKNGQRYVINVDSNNSVPILVKISWSKNWVARNEKGKRIETFLATPGYVLLFGKGKIVLQNEKTLIELIARLISLAGLIGLILLCYFSWRKNLKKKHKKILMQVKNINAKKLKKSFDGIVKKSLKKKDWIVFAVIAIFCVWLVFSVVDITQRRAFSAELFEKETYHVNLNDPIGQIYLKGGDVFCVFENNSKLFIKGDESLAILKDGFFYYDRGEDLVLKENAGKFSNGFFAVLKSLGEPVYCEDDSAEKNGFYDVLTSILLQQALDKTN